jgi:hypothetical protein
MMEQPPCTRVAKVAAKKLVVNLMLGSAVGEGAPPQLDFFFFFWRGRK